MMHRCLIIADDLTGGADAGAQFAKKNLQTLLISPQKNERVYFQKYVSQDILVINTNSRGLSPEEAYQSISNLLTEYEESLFPILYKKIDSTLRGNIGYEIDAILEKTNNRLCFVAPSYPEQNRILIGGIMIVGEKPLALTEVARKTSSPIQESHVYKILQDQSRNKVGWIDLTHVASSCEGLRKAIEVEKSKGTWIIIFDAVSRQDLKNIAEVGFSLERKPLFVGSAGLAEEVAHILNPAGQGNSSKRMNQFRNILIISGTASSITHQQLKRVEENGIASYELTPYLIHTDWSKTQEERESLSEKIANSLSHGVCILKTPLEILSPLESIDGPIHLKITKILASLALRAIERSQIHPNDLALILTGGETAQYMINGLNPHEIQIEGELLEGIVIGKLIGGDWNGVSVITKAGAFGKEDALEKIIKMLTQSKTLDIKGDSNESLDQG
ncbi:MAG: four-carbon acid sugar kinase family protein [Thermodesulfobacteriota bacterium]